MRIGFALYVRYVFFSIPGSGATLDGCLLLIAHTLNKPEADKSPLSNLDPDE